MSSIRTARAFAVIALLVTGLTAAATPTAPTLESAAILWHTRLTKSMPAKDDTVATSPKALQLWFSEKVDLGLFKVTLNDAAGTTLALGAPAYEGTAAPASAIALALKAPVAAGKYTVNWTVAGADGHPTKGSYDFVVKVSR